jgi:SAM-dependent methyltransferase
MSVGAMSPYDLALWDTFQGDASVKVIVRRDDGLESEMPMAEFFRSFKEFSVIEVKALDLCKGKVLDAGAGAGNHSLELQKRGYDVWAIDIGPHAVDIMTARGVHHAQRVNVYDLTSPGFDTILMLMHGIGLAGTLDGFDMFLNHARHLLKPDGIIVFDSLDVQHTDKTVHLMYQEENRKAGRYFGEIRSRFEYKGQIGDYFSWLHIDPATLYSHASQQGWESRIIHQEQDGNYLACLTQIQRSER